MPTIERFGVSIEDDILSRFDKLIKERGYTSRSEAIRDLMRQEFIRTEWSANTLAELQHQHHGNIVCSTHIHLDAHNCLEVIVIRGRAEDVRTVANTLISIRGVKHGQLVCTTTGENVS